MSFPSERQFRRWWKGKRDHPDKEKRHTNCPLARYLRAHGMPGAEVGKTCWVATPHGNLHDLPLWAVRVVQEFDGG